MMLRGALVSNDQIAPLLNDNLIAAILGVTNKATRAMAAMPDAHVNVDRRRSREDIDTAVHSRQWRKWPCPKNNVLECEVVGGKSEIKRKLDKLVCSPFSIFKWSSLLMF